MVERVEILRELIGEASKGWFQTITNPTNESFFFLLMKPVNFGQAKAFPWVRDGAHFVEPVNPKDISWIPRCLWKYNPSINGRGYT